MPQPTPAHPHAAILEKVAKLLAMADTSRNPNEEEAAAAMRMATRLLDKHNLEMADALAHQQASNPDSAPAPIAEHSYPYPHNPEHAFIGVLAHGVAPLYFAKTYRTRSADAKTAYACFVGRPHNTQVAVSMVEYLIRTIERMAADALTKAIFARNQQAIGQPHLWLRSYREGATSNLYHRAQQLVAERNAPTPAPNPTTQPTTTLPALIAQELAAIDEHLAQLNLRKGRPSRRKTLYGAYATGSSDAANVNLHANHIAPSTGTAPVAAITAR